MAANGHVSATARQAGRLDARGCHQQPAPRRAVSPVHATTSERSAREGDHSIRRSKNRRPPPPPSPCAKIMLGVGGEREGEGGGLRLGLSGRSPLAAGCGFTRAAGGRREDAEILSTRVPPALLACCWRCDRWILSPPGWDSGRVFIAGPALRAPCPSARDRDSARASSVHHLPVSRSLRLASTTGTGWAMICFFLRCCGWARPCLVWWRGEVKTRRTIFFFL